MKSKSSSDIREVFLKFFEKNEHLIHPPSSLIPSNDPTLLLTNSGMAQFKNYFSGEADPPSKRITSSQKCFRSTDIDEVGDSTHLTLFEMLGNFSFGDYFKEEACKLALDLMVKELNFDLNKIFITVHNDDPEAKEVWLNLGIPEEKIFFFGDSDNWWGPAGDEGPCGPCSELHYYVGDEKIDSKIEENDPNWGPNLHEDFIELYNLVFTQFYHHLDGKRTELPNKNIDTGMGLERVATILQGKKTVYQTDLFEKIIEKIEKNCKYKFGKPKEINKVSSDKAIAILAEHSRSATFLIADGVIPENVGRGYILRRLIRKAMRYGFLLNLNEKFIIELSKEVINSMGNFYPELIDNEKFISEVFNNECKSFSKTLSSGEKILEQLIVNRSDIQKIINKNNDSNSNDKEFIEKIIESEAGHQGLISQLIQKDIDTSRLLKKNDLDIYNDIRLKITNTNWAKEVSYLETSYLYDTLGFPFEVTSEYCSTHKLYTDKEKFDEKMKMFQELSKTTSDFGGDKSVVNLVNKLNLTKTSFIGYSETFSKGKVISIIDNNLEKKLESFSENENEFYLILDQTPFYPEGGGQVGDTGILKNKNSKINIIDTQEIVEGFIFHKAKLENGSISINDQIETQVNLESRNASKRNHTGTHLLQAALREILGKHVKQQGSLVSPDRLRFDFTHMNKLTDQEILSVQDLMNVKIRSNLPVKKHETTYTKAIQEGAIAFFGDKYGKDVRTVEISNGSKFSYELCGGTHCENTGEIGSFYIVSETSISSGVRRIEAVTGKNAEDYAIKNFSIIKKLSNDLNSKPEEISEKINFLNQTIKNLKKELSNSNNSDEIIEKIIHSELIINGHKTVISNLENLDPKKLRDTIELIKKKYEGIAILTSVYEEKINLVIYVPKVYSEKFKANEMIKSVSKIIGGGGGGNPVIAQGGGTKVNSIDEIIKSLTKYIKNG
tara:strand:+ start:1045 stop:3900 length:2856 start_codon:yes stop_codon:yes gene_type:complete